MTDSPLEKKPGTAPETKPAVKDADAAAVSVRASDADRDRIADILREALAEGRLDAEEHAERIDAVYGAKTMGELEPLVRDLPAGRAGSEAAPASGPDRYEWTAPAQGALAKDDVVAIFSGSTRKGRYRVPGKINAFACFGGIEIDLTEAVFEQQHVQINATAVFGGIEIRVPENITLRQKGTGIFGGFEVRTTEAEDPRAPVVLVQGAAIFGGVEAKPKLGKRLRDLRDRLRKEL
ncbi:hypothetical protein DB35_14730 [Streptomyces abyssalis]|uniref:Uncharacterized protein n=1 Tax=Streptomyces abyssalis TaxID=933944 RepID=A0A1E7JG56_9ACTN|nr:DUF1707 domain-containing protein [Streptomyces abyssalis]OEU85456.1 hypothetical protein AN215_23280 [Streptomyces abyssalis]OEU93081.1 hypothetical protein DB35_14730 [Streptomyces abyssalis]OEV06816.1 hypothetical protein AN219_33395 [Streptomyces nanshensis]